MKNTVEVVQIIASSLSPVLSAVLVLIITKHHERKLFRDKYIYEQLAAKRIEHIERYVSYINGRILREEDKGSRTTERDEIYLYIDKSLHHYVDEIDHYLTQSKFREAASLLSVLCKKLDLTG